MRLKNYNEDLVLETVKVVLKDRADVRPSRSFILDVAAYVLNRTPPKYITSERGFTHEVLQAAGGDGTEEQRLVNVIELITHINQAIEVVARRRRNGASVGQKRPPRSSASEDGARAASLLLQHAPHLRTDRGCTGWRVRRSPGVCHGAVCPARRTLVA